jgi:hypothetical protein
MGPYLSILVGHGERFWERSRLLYPRLREGNEKLETRGMALAMGMWGWGFLFPPALSGALAEQLRDTELLCHVCHLTIV